MMAARRVSDRLIDRLPPVRGRLTADAPLAPITWFRVGGAAEIMFRPADEADLAEFLAHRPPEVPVTVLGVASNLLVRDGGIPGIVIRLGRGFVGVATEGETVRAGAGALDLNVALTCREATQPVRARTGGSTFQNPPGQKAWELIDAAGCRGLARGGAQISEKHANFLINTGNATAADLEGLGEEVRRRVFETSGITLEWEIKRVGRPLPGLGEAVPS